MLSLSLKALKGLKIKFKYRGLKKWISKFGVENFKIQKLRVVNIYGLKFRVKILGLKNLAKGFMLYFSIRTRPVCLNKN